MQKELILYIKEKLILEIEKKYQCNIIVAGFDGSRVIGLNNYKSDYDIVIIAEFNNKTDISDKYIIFDKMYIFNSNIEYKIFNYNDILNNIYLWEKKSKCYPTVCFMRNDRYARNDLLRNLFRIVIQNPLFINKSFIGELQDKEKYFFKMIDYVDFNFSRAVGNYRKFCKKDRVLVRKYLYTLYELFAIKWTLEYNTYPPCAEVLLKKYLLDMKMYSFIVSLMRKNLLGEDKSKLYVSKNDILNKFIRNELKNIFYKIYELKSNEYSHLIKYKINIIKHEVV